MYIHTHTYTKFSGAWFVRHAYMQSCELVDEGSPVRGSGVCESAAKVVVYTDFNIIIEVVWEISNLWEQKHRSMKKPKYGVYNYTHTVLRIENIKSCVKHVEMTRTHVQQ